LRVGRCGVLVAPVLLLALVHCNAWKGFSTKLVALLEPELLRPERLSEVFPGGLDELRSAYDPFDFGLGTVAPHVVFSDHLPQGTSFSMRARM
jgi:hypothetical protein